MSKHIVISVRDSAVLCFGPLMLVPAVGAGIRMFTDEVNKGGTNLNAHPDDYELWQLGIYDDETGGVVQEGDSVRVLCRGKDVVVRHSSV